MKERSRVLFRDLVRARRDEAARKRMLKPHVEFCTECGKACDRTGRRNLSICVTCARERKEAS